MPTVYLVRQGGMLRREDNALALYLRQRRMERIPLEAVDRVVVLGCVTLTPAAVTLLLSKGIDTVFLSRSGRYLGRLMTAAGPNVFLRVRQVHRLDDGEFRLAVARTLVASKIAGQCRVVESRARRAAREVLRRGLEKLEEARPAVEAAPSLDDLRGVEGRAAAVYFRCFGEMLEGSAFRFDGRNRRPPRDPVNVLLSFGYTLLASALEREVSALGLDPALGCLHELVYGRPSLVLDLMEEFRPGVVDALVLRICNRRQIRLEDFYFPDDMAAEARHDPEFFELARESPVVFTHEGSRKFIDLFEARLGERAGVEGRKERADWRSLLRRQVTRYARALRGEEDFAPLGWSGPEISGEDLS